MPDLGWKGLLLGPWVSGEAACYVPPWGPLLSLQAVGLLSGAVGVAPAMFPSGHSPTGSLGAQDRLGPQQRRLDQVTGLWQGLQLAPRSVSLLTRAQLGPEWSPRGPGLFPFVGRTVVW